MKTDLASADCQIGQAAIAQSEKIEIPPETLFNKLPFTHLALIMSVERPLARTFYELETIKGVWSSRELKRQIDSNYFERTALSKDPAKMNLYLAYYRKNVMEKGDNPPVGILMCTKAGKELVESLFVQKYKLNLPAEDELTKWLKNEISGTNG